jgi:hypothetical protein
MAAVRQKNTFFVEPLKSNKRRYGKADFARWGAVCECRRKPTRHDLASTPCRFGAALVLLSIGTFGTAEAQIAGSGYPGFESSLLKKPNDWNGDLFSANYDFPDHAADMTGQPWLTLSPSKPSERDRYFQAVLNYGLTAFPKDIRHGCPEPSLNWYHVPWLTFSFGNTQADLQQGVIGSGREPICGMTQERQAPVGFLHKQQTQVVQTWAVGSFNETGGVLLGKTWKNPKSADLTNLAFDNGSFIIKFLFTEAGTDQVPYLLGSPEWHANIYPSASDTSSRVTKTLRLIQIDFGVRDKNFDHATGWVYGTFLYYNGDTTVPSDWKSKLLPVGVMWGNDPGKTDPATFVQQYSNPKVIDLVKQGKIFDLSKRTVFGWHGRVNGVVDNPVSSCLSCHGTAQVHPQTNIKQFITPALVNGQASDENKMLWFRNIQAGETFTFTPEELEIVRQGDPGLLRATWTQDLMRDFVSTDYSLQLRMAIENERFYTGIEKAVVDLTNASAQGKEPIIDEATRGRLVDAFKAESKVIVRAGESEE